MKATKNRLLKDTTTNVTNKPNFMRSEEEPLKNKAFRLYFLFKMIKSIVILNFKI